jgi:hypothetical protein
MAGVIESDTTTSRFVGVAGYISGPIFAYENLVVHSGFSANVDHVPPEFAGLFLISEYDPVKVVGPVSKIHARHITFSE